MSEQEEELRQARRLLGRFRGRDRDERRRGEEAILSFLRLLELKQEVLETQLELLLTLVKDLQRKEEHVSVVIDLLREQVAAVRTSVTNVQTSLAALVQRLSDNPTAQEVAAITEELRALQPEVQNIAPALDSLDPDVPGGAVDETTGTGTPADTPPV